MKRILLLLFLFLPLTATAAQLGDSLLSADGPYLTYDSLGTGATLLTVDLKGRIHQKHVKALRSDYRLEVQTADGSHHFEVQLHNVQQPRWDYPMPDEMFITSDPHGNFDCLYTLLVGNRVMDDKCNWTFGRGHLVIIGDVMDRGVDVVPIYWLMYKLEAQAAEAGGALTFVFGNHEPFILNNDNRYTERKYTHLAELLSTRYSTLWSPRTELGRWLLSRNCMTRIGRQLIVHAGLGADFYRMNLSIPEVNALFPAGLYMRSRARRGVGDKVYRLHANQGPIWYRGLVRDDPKYRPVSSDTLDLILQRYDVDRLLVGHTINDEITTYYEGRVIDVNVDNLENRTLGRSRALLMRDGKTYIVGDHGIMKQL